MRALKKSYSRRYSWHQHLHIDALKVVDFDISLGKTLALIGSSGSGKSTVARCVARLDQPDPGEIWIDGEQAPGHWYPTGGGLGTGAYLTVNETWRR